MRLLISATFFLLAGWFLMYSGAGALPQFERQHVDPASIAPVPRRAILRDPAKVTIGGIEQRCSACHAIFPSTQDAPAARLQHTEIVLEHGLNDRCDNCHDKGDHDGFVLYGGRVVGFDDVQLLCAKCHGPTFRDWERGVHGKTLGSWVVGSDAQRRLLCTECHDPHHPAFTPYVPLPGPHTLRQHATERHADEHDHEAYNPLRHWRTEAEDAPEEGAH
ncbi:MAG: hypothetical protein H6828_01255 [Planctomycetes bacterium]|nr:hypothetical protein [Planctomycetota bacterium]